MIWTIDKIYEELKNKFSHFCPVTVEQLDYVEKELGFPIPSQLRVFYEQIGHGSISLDSQGRESDVYLNILIEPELLVILYKKEDPDWEMDYDLLEEDDMPFFYLGSQDYFVLNPHSTNPNVVHDPCNRSTNLGTFNEFICKLYEDCTFYLSK